MRVRVLVRVSVCEREKERSKNTFVCLEFEGVLEKQVLMTC